MKMRNMYAYQNDRNFTRQHHRQSHFYCHVLLIVTTTYLIALIIHNLRDTRNEFVTNFIAQRTLLFYFFFKSRMAQAAVE